MAEQWIHLELTGGETEVWYSELVAAVLLLPVYICVCEAEIKP